MNAGTTSKRGYVPAFIRLPDALPDALLDTLLDKTRYQNQDCAHGGRKTPRWGGWGTETSTGGWETSNPGRFQGWGWLLSFTVRTGQCLP
jgi:hypothetical protein